MKSENVMPSKHLFQCCIPYYYYARSDDGIIFSSVCLCVCLSVSWSDNVISNEPLEISSRNFQGILSSSVAAPDHKSRQCIQRSALFPGRADGRTEGPERDARSGAKRRSAKRVGSGEIRGSGGYAPRKICKNQL